MKTRGCWSQLIAVALMGAAALALLLIAIAIAGCASPEYWAAGEDTLGASQAGAAGKRGQMIASACICNAQKCNGIESGYYTGQAAVEMASGQQRSISGTRTRAARTR